MTNRLIVFILFPCLIIALTLSLAGVQQIQFGDTYYNFLRDVNRDFVNWSFQIPKIPKINPMVDSGFDSGGLILSVLIKIGNFFVTIINGLIGIINVLITIINVFISLIQFVLTLVYRVIAFRDSLINVSVVR